MLNAAIKIYVSKDVANVLAVIGAIATVGTAVLLLRSIKVRELRLRHFRWVLFIVLPISLYAGVALAYGVKRSNHTGAVRDRYQLVAQLAAEHAAKLSDASGSLVQACAGRLPTGGPESLVGYVAEL